MRTACLLLLLASAGRAEDLVQIKLAREVSVADLVKTVHLSLDRPILYAPADIAGKELGGDYDMSVPKDRLEDAFVFLFSMCGREVRRFDPLLVVVPTDARATEFRLTGLDLPLRFHRAPGAWRTAEDMAGSLTQETAAALLQAAAKGDVPAATLLGRAAPRDDKAAHALLGLLRDGPPAVHDAAADGLAGLGWTARPVLEDLRKLGPSPALKRAIAAIENARSPALTDPSLANETAPATYTVRLDTTEGEILIDVVRDWAPRRADRFYNLVKIGFFDDCAFFRVVKGFIAQFGKTGDPEVNKAWFNANIDDEKAIKLNRRGYLSFAKAGPNTASTQVFINLADNTHLDKGFAPFGEITKGLDVADRLYSGYGERVDQSQLHWQGKAYLQQFPRLDVIKTARIVK